MYVGVSLKEKQKENETDHDFSKILSIYF